VQTEHPRRRAVIDNVDTIIFYLQNAVALGGAYDRGRASPLGHNNLLQWVVGLQHQRRRRLFVLKKENYVAEGKES